LRQNNLAQIALNKGIPFEIRIPNKLTAKTLKESENGKELHKVSNTEELFIERTGSHSELFKK
jgi:DNA-damage-inducible protein J